MVRASDKVQGKLKLCGIFFGKMGMRFLVLSSFSHCKLKCLGSMYFTMYINFIIFSLKQEKPNHTLLPLYIFLSAMHLNLKAKVQFYMSNWLFLWIVLLQDKNIFKILAMLFLLSMLRHAIMLLTSNQHSSPVRNMMRSWPVPRII